MQAAFHKHMFSERRDSQVTES